MATKAVMSKQGRSKLGRGGSGQRRSGQSRSGQCRIIAGDWRGRIIRFEDAEGLRPTTDRIRETVFNWLHPYIAGSYCLDCFAGSGVLGLEALSRGAEEVVFIESNRHTFDNLKQNISMLVGEPGLEGESGASVSAGRATARHEDAISFLRSDQLKKQSLLMPPFDLVFLDPPFHKGLLSESSLLLDSSGCLAEDAIIYVEHATDEPVELPPNWNCVKQKAAGQVAYKLYTRQAAT